MNGNGIIYFSYGGYAKGQFRLSKLNGCAILKFPNKDYYEGNWLNGKLEGQCFKYFEQDKTGIICEYNDGVFNTTLIKVNLQDYQSIIIIYYQLEI